MIIIDYDASIPLYQQIYEKIKTQIITNEIPGGSKLPSIRTLEEKLKVSRNTVENAYQQLKSEGYIESKPGSGFVALNLESMELLKPHASSSSYIPKKNTDIYKYNFRNRSLSANEFPINHWKRLTNHCLSAMTPDDFTGYNAKIGEYDLQVELMKYLKSSRGVICNPEQIIITSGMEYTLGLICQMFRSEFNQVAIEEPGYMVARQIFKNNGFEVRPISLDNDGINLHALHQSQAKIVYVTPTHQFPMGYVMPIKKRIQLLEWAKKHHGYIIEDDYDSEFRYNSRPIPALQGIDSVGSVIYLGTFSKSLSPGLRISYLVLPKNLLEKFEQTFSWYRVSVSLIQQKVLQQFMHLGYWERHLRRIHLSALKKHDLLIQTIKDELGDKVIIHGENGGLHIILEINNGLSELEIIKRLKGASISVSPVSIFWENPQNYSDNMILLGFGGMPETEMVEGIKKLKEALF